MHPTDPLTEDTEQIHAISGEVTATFYYDETGFVLNGPQKGQHIFLAEKQEIWRWARPWCNPRSEQVTLRPWWRLFRPTKALRIVIG